MAFELRFPDVGEGIHEGRVVEWLVAEDGAVALSGEFVSALSSGSDPREALRSARAQIRKSGYEHPFYWAAFILMSH